MSEQYERKVAFSPGGQYAVYYPRGRTEVQPFTEDGQTFTGYTVDNADLAMEILDGLHFNASVTLPNDRDQHGRFLWEIVRVGTVSIFERLYASEINCSVSSDWDGGWTVKLGDELNGFKAEASGLKWEEVDPWLTEQAIKHFPDSRFAKWHSRSVSAEPLSVT